VKLESVVVLGAGEADSATTQITLPLGPTAATELMVVVPEWTEMLKPVLGWATLGSASDETDTDGAAPVGAGAELQLDTAEVSWAYAEEAAAADGVWTSDSWSLAPVVRSVKVAEREGKSAWMPSTCFRQAGAVDGRLVVDPLWLCTPELLQPLGRSAVVSRSATRPASGAGTVVVVVVEPLEDAGDVDPPTGSTGADPVGDVPVRGLAGAVVVVALPAPGRRDASVDVVPDEHAARSSPRATAPVAPASALPSHCTPMRGGLCPLASPLMVSPYR